MKIRFSIALFIVFIQTTTTMAAETRIATWNVREVFNVDSVTIRARDFYRFAKRVKPDILCLQEVTSLNVVEAIRDAMHLKGYYIACSDFNQRDDQRYNSFEVAVISKFPISSILEYDPLPDNELKLDPQEIKLQPSWELGMPAMLTYRGFLWLKIEKPKLTLVVTHLKSSRGYVGKRMRKTPLSVNMLLLPSQKASCRINFIFPNTPRWCAAILMSAIPIL